MAEHETSSGWSIQASKSINFEDPSYKAALQSAARNDPTIVERLAKIFPNATEQIHDIIKAPVGLHLSHTSAPRPHALTILKQNEAVKATSIDRLATSLKTPTSHFSMVYAVSQGLLNKSFELLHMLNENLQSIKYSSPHWGSIDAELEAPKISLSVIGQNPPLWYMYFGERGSCSVWSDDIEDFVEIPTKNWRIVFSVPLNNIPVEPGTADHDTIMGEIGSDKPGDYSISRLVMDFQSADVDNLLIEKCDFGGYPMTNDIRDGLSNFIRHWTIGASDSNAGTLGYSWTTSNPQDVYHAAPTFPPTDKLYQTYYYLGSSTSSPVEGLDVGDKNMLLYLEMTDHQPFPKERYLDYSGNWTTSDIPATMCIGSSIFFDSYLMRSMSGSGLLSKLNYATYIEAISCFCDYGTDSEFRWNYSKRDHSSDLSFFDWKRSGSGWEWKLETYAHDQDYPMFDDSASGTGCENSVTATVNNFMSVAPGGRSISVTGSTKVELYQFSELAWISSSGTATATVEWDINITVDSVRQGGLEIIMNLPENESDWFKVTTEHTDNWLMDGGTMAQVADEVAGHVEDRTSIREVANELQNALKGTGKFVFPGAGTFLYKNPMYNNELDLLVETSYNGVDDFLGRKKRGRFAPKS